MTDQIERRKGDRRDTIDEQVALYQKGFEAGKIHERSSTETIDRIADMKKEITAECKDNYAIKLTQIIVFYGVGIVLTGVLGAVLSLVIFNYKQ